MPEPLAPTSPTMPRAVPFLIPFIQHSPHALTQSSLLPTHTHNALCICISMRCPSEIVICDLCFVLCIRSPATSSSSFYPIHGESLHATSIPFQSQSSQSNALISTLSLPSDLCLLSFSLSEFVFMLCAHCYCYT